jgi:VanZ family protein
MATARAGRMVRVFWTAVATGTVISVGVETLQLFSKYRKASVLDVLANGGGAFLGALVFIVAIRWLAGKRADKSYVGIPATLFAGAYGIVILGEALVPYFRQTRLRVRGGPLERLSFALENYLPFSPADLPLSDTVLFAPAGFFLAVALVEAGLGHRKAGLIAAVTTSCLVVATEIAHGALSLAIRGGPIAVHVVSLAVGALGAIWLLPWIANNFRGRERPQLLYLVYTLILLPWFFRPYVPRFSPGAWMEELTGRWWLPMIYATSRMDVFSVIDVTNMFFLFVPVGCLLAAWPLRSAGRLVGIVPGLVLVVVLEGMQIFVAGRTMAIADMLIGMAGVWAGWVMIRMAGFPVRGTTLEG